MPEITAAEALARATSPTQWRMIDDPPRDGQWHSATLKEPLLWFSEVAIVRLRALGFVIVPVEADDTTIERIGDAIYQANPYLDAGEISAHARAAYAAMVAPDTATEKRNG